MLQEQIRRKAMRDTTQSYHEELLCYMECREKIPPEKIPPIRWHFREQCTQCPFIPGREVVHCQLCKCFVCDLPAGKCSHWGPPHNHCKATYKALEWQRARCRSLHGLPPMMAPPMPKVERHGIGRSVLPKSEATAFAGWDIEERAERYRRATEALGEERLARLEQMLRSKLFNRVAAGPFQLRRNFKYFDKDGNGTIDLDEFIECLEGLMGIVLPHDHVIALFARYDEDCGGTMDYQEFIAQLMGETKVRRFSKDESGLGNGGRRRPSHDGRGERAVDILSHLPPSSSRWKYAPKWDPESIARNFPWNPLHGSEEGSLDSCRPQLIPKKARQKERKFQTRRFAAQFANPAPADVVRRFEVTLQLDDNTILIYEPPQRNSGFSGGIFLRTNTRTRNEENGRILGKGSFFEGATFRLAGMDFVITAVLTGAELPSAAPEANNSSSIAAMSVLSEDTADADSLAPSLTSIEKKTKMPLPLLDLATLQQSLSGQ